MTNPNKQLSGKELAIAVNKALANKADCDGDFYLMNEILLKKGVMDAEKYLDQKAKDILLSEDDGVKMSEKIDDYLFNKHKQSWTDDSMSDCPNNHAVIMGRLWWRSLTPEKILNVVLDGELI